MSELNPEQVVSTLDALGAKGIVGTVVIGFLAGVLAKVIMPGKDPGGLIITTLLGIGGSYLATYLGHKFGLFSTGHVSGFIAAAVGAILILLVYRIIFRRK